MEIQQQHEPGITTSIKRAPDGKIESIQFSGYFDKDVTEETVKQATQSISASVIEILQKLAS